MKLIRARLGDVVDLGCSIAPLIHGIGKCVDGRFRDQIGIATRLVERPLFRLVSGSFVSSRHDVAIWQAARNFHVSVPGCVANKVVAACRVDQRSRGKLQRVGHVAAWIRQVLQRWRIQNGGCICVSRLMSGASLLASTVSLDRATLHVKSTVCFCPNLKRRCHCAPDRNLAPTVTE